MEVTLVKPLTPLPNGVIVIVGAKSGNFDHVIMTHPRVVIWDSQNQHWTNKDLPSNTKAIFMTRFVGHSAYGRILAEARKKQILLFNPEGTGVIARQVKQLLGIETPGLVFTGVKEDIAHAVVSTPKETEMEKPKHIQNKLKPLEQFIDVTKGHADNARVLLVKATELGIETTFHSLGQYVMHYKRKLSGIPKVPRSAPKSTSKQVDVSVEILDGMIKELQDMRQFLIDTVEENHSLRARMESFRKLVL